MVRVAVALFAALATAPLAAQVSADSNWVRSKTGLTWRDVVVGKGDTARSGQHVTIHEVTKLTNGTVVFDSYAKNQPITFLLGGNQVIAGVEEGVTGMRAGGRRTLIIPPRLSHRSSYPANTPKDSVLRIDLELVAIRP